MLSWTELDAVLFDVDGTLYSLDRLKLRYLLRHPLRVREVMALGKARESLREEESPRPDLWDELLRRAAKTLGWPLERTREANRRFIEDDWPRLLRAQGPLPGLSTVLDVAEAAGVRTGVLSDYPPEAKLEALGLARRPWVCRLDASGLGALKPHPHAFEQALEALDAPPDRVLYVGDRLDTDVAGARNVGMRAALRVEPRKRKPPQEHDDVLVFTDYKELSQLLGGAG